MQRVENVLSYRVGLLHIEILDRIDMRDIASERLSFDTIETVSYKIIDEILTSDTQIGLIDRTRLTATTTAIANRITEQSWREVNLKHECAKR